MSSTRKRLAVFGGAAAGLVSALIALSPTAAADPATPPPAIPGGTELLQQFAAWPARAPQAIESATAALTGATPTTPAPAQPSAASLLGLPTPATSPATAPVAAQPAAAAQSPVPSGSINLPSVPGLPMPLPQQLSLPMDVSAFLPGAVAAAKPSVPALAGAPAAPASSAPQTLLGGLP